MKRIAWFSVIALAVAACAQGTDNSDALDGPVVASECAEEAPDCDDAAVDDGVSSGVLADGGLTVSAALATNATGVLAVQGFLVSDASGVRLCEALAESYPPQCGGASIAVSGLTNLDVLTVSEGDVRWSEPSIVVFGQIVDGVLVPTEGATA